MNFPINEIYEKTKIDPWFLRQVQEIVNIEKEINEKKYSRK